MGCHAKRQQHPTTMQKRNIVNQTEHSESWDKLWPFNPGQPGQHKRWKRVKKHTLLLNSYMKFVHLPCPHREKIVAPKGRKLKSEKISKKLREQSQLSGKRNMGSFANWMKFSVIFKHSKQLIENNPTTVGNSRAKIPKQKSYPAEPASAFKRENKITYRNEYISNTYL